MLDHLPPVTFEEALDMRLPQPLDVYVLPRRDAEFDADRLVAAYRRSTVVRTFERHALTMDLVDELDALLDAYLGKAQRNR